MAKMQFHWHNKN